MKSATSRARADRFLLPMVTPVPALLVWPSIIACNSSRACDIKNAARELEARGRHSEACGFQKLFPKFGLELPVAQILRDFGAFLIGLTEPHLDGLNADGLLEAGRVDLDALIEEVSGREEAGHACEGIVEVVERIGVHRIRAMEFLDANHVSHRVPLSCAALRVAAD